MPRNHGKKNTTLIASMTLGGAMGECMVVEGSTKASFVFEAYVERFPFGALALAGAGRGDGQPLGAQDG